MLKGNITFVCTDCGQEFDEMGIQWKNTDLITLVKCVKCGSIRTFPKIISWLDRVRYKMLWKQME